MAAGRGRCEAAGMAMTLGVGYECAAGGARGTANHSRSSSRQGRGVVAGRLAA